MPVNEYATNQWFINSHKNEQVKKIQNFHQVEKCRFLNKFWEDNVLDYLLNY